jgi:hypothetical protein
MIFEIILLISFILYSIFSIILTLNIGRLDEKEKENQSLAFKFIVIYGTCVIIIFPISFLIYFIVKLIMLLF